MSRLEKMANIAKDQALLSNLRFRHGALLTKGSKILAKGFNTSRSSFMFSNQTCLHAEMSVIYYYLMSILHIKLNLNKKKYIPELSKCTIWVVRLSSNNDLVDSKPCKICLDTMKKIGIKKIGYSDTNGNIILTNINKLSSDHQSDAQLSYNHL